MINNKANILLLVLVVIAGHFAFAATINFTQLATIGGILSNPYRIAVDQNGSIYVADTVNNAIKKFDKSGKLITTFGIYGGEDGQFNQPQGIAVDTGGNIYEGRNIKVQGCHTLNKNYGNIGVCLLGNYMEMNVNPVQQKKLEDLLVYLCRKYTVQTSNIYGHRDLGNTECPGNNFYNILPEIRANVKQRLQ